MLTFPKFFDAIQMRMFMRTLQFLFQICTFLILTVLFVCTSHAQTSVDVNRKFTREQLIEDINFYIKTLEETHINPYIHISQKQWRAQAEDIKSRIAKQGAMTQQEFALIFTPLVSAVRDRHTFVVEPRFFIPNNPTKYLPVRTVYIDGKILVTDSFADEKIRKGAIITDVNGIKIEEVIRKLSEYRFGVEKERIEFAAEWLWIGAAEVFGKPNSFVLSFSDGTKAEVQGLTVLEIIRRERAAKANVAKMSDAPLELKFLARNVAYLNSSTFSYDLEKYKVLLEDVFTRIKSSGAKSLIVDLRSNTGGNSMLGNALIDMFNRKNYKDYSMKWKRSAQYVEYLKSEQKPIPTYYQSLNPGEVYVSKPATVKPGANPLRFGGDVYVLSAKETFSSGQMFLALVKGNKLAKIIGEETNTPACNPGELYLFNLPNSRLRVSSSVKFWTPPGGCNGAKGIVPDVVVTERLDDYLTEKDVILEETLGLIGRKQ